MDLIESFNIAKQALYDHVGFVEDWVIYAVEDRTDMLWQIDNYEIKFAKTIEDFNSDGDYYLDEIYTQRFYEKHIYRGDTFTMVFVDTHTDGNKFFAFYRNDKEVKQSGELNQVRKLNQVYKQIH